MKKTFLLVGAGSRGLLSYGKCLEDIPDADVVAVAEPREWYRKEAVRRHQIPEENVFTSWKELEDVPKLADAVIIATQDSDHITPAIMLMKKGYHVLLEKPMATTLEDCLQIYKQSVESDVILSVCHVLRYTPYFRKIKSLLNEGVIGQVISVDHQERVAYWHHAHSYVRGNWRKESESSPMILAKSCHDMDILLYLLGNECESLSSYGALHHFRAENKPKDAASRCLDCTLADEGCPYSAKKIYLSRAEQGEFEWPVDILTTDHSVDGVIRALKEGPYGRCVYECDNDVVDNQVVALKFKGGIEATFTMTAFTADCARQTEIFGSLGTLKGNTEKLEVCSFLTGETTQIDFAEHSNDVSGGHLGGDRGIVVDFLETLRTKKPEQVRESALDALRSHVMAFAAEQSRKENGQAQELASYFNLENTL